MIPEEDLKQALKNLTANIVYQMKRANKENGLFYNAYMQEREFLIRELERWEELRKQNNGESLIDIE